MMEYDGKYFVALLCDFWNKIKNFIPKINADWTFPLLPCLLEFLSEKHKTFKEKMEPYIHIWPSACVCAGGWGTKTEAENFNQSSGQGKNRPLRQQCVRVQGARTGVAYWFRCRWTHLSEISITTYLMTVHLSASIGELSCLFTCGCTCSNASPCLFMVSTPPCWREEHIALRWSSVRPEGWMSASSAVQ